MKNVCLSFVFCLVLLSPLSSMANANRLSTLSDSSQTSLFDFDEAAIYQSVADLTKLENHLAMQPGTSLSQLQATDDPIIRDIQFMSDPSMTMTEPPLGIPSFIWGFCLGLIGMLVVYLVTEDKEEVKLSLYGCLVSSAVSAIIRVIFELNQ